MHDNTPPRVPDIEDDDSEEEVILDVDNAPPDDDYEDDELEMEEVTLAELQNRLGVTDEDDEAYYGPIQDDAKLTFSQHTAPVFACSMHTQRNWAATGSEDDRVLIWNIDSGELIYEIKEHKDTVTETRFSHDGNYLATGDLAGEIIVHKLCENSQSDATIFRKVWEYSMGDMSWMRWHRSANVLIAGSENGEIYVWRIPSGDCKILPGHGIRCESGELSNDGKKLFCAYVNGVVKLWDLKSCTVIMEIDEHHPMALLDGAFVVACDKETPIYACGGGDGKIVFCTNSGPVGVVDAVGTVECLAFSTSAETKVIASGTLGGQIAIWDYTKFSLRILCDNPIPDDGILRLKWISDYTLLVSTMQGHIYGFDTRSGVCKFTLSGHHTDIYEFCYNPNEKILLSVSEDKTAKIFDIPQLGD